MWTEILILLLDRRGEDVKEFGFKDHWGGGIRFHQSCSVAQRLVTLANATAALALANFAKHSFLGIQSPTIVFYDRVSNKNSSP